MTFWSVEAHKKWNKDHSLVGPDSMLGDLNSQVAIIYFL